MLMESGVFEEENQENKFVFALTESSAPFAQHLVDKFGLNITISWDDAMDYVSEAVYQGKKGLYSENMYVSGMFAFNNKNFGNFLWGAGMNALGFGHITASMAAHVHNIFELGLGFRFVFDSRDDQFSIYLGYNWRQ